MEDFEKAFKAAIEFAKKDKNTLVIAQPTTQQVDFQLVLKVIISGFRKCGFFVIIVFMSRPLKDFLYNTFFVEFFNYFL